MDYEQKYKEALGWMKDVYPTLEGAAKEDAEHYFPELKESEDEKIKKWLIGFFNQYKIDGFPEFSTGMKVDSIIDWLEKQGEQKQQHLLTKERAMETSPFVEQKTTKTPQWMIDFLEDLRSHFGRNMGYDERREVDGNLLCIKNWLEKQGEQKHTIIIPRFRVGDTIRIKNSDAEYTITEISDGYYRGKGWCLDIAAGDECGDYELVEQKSVDKVESNLLTVERAKEISPFMRSGFENESAAWSEDDEKILRTIISDGIRGAGFDMLQIDWLKSIKDKVQLQPKQEWSKEDEGNINKILHFLQGGGLIRGQRERLFSWLESLKERVLPQPKREWSEDDEKMWATISDLLWDGYEMSDGKVSWDNIRYWLLPKITSLRYQNTWKPSDEQMEALLYEVNAWDEGSINGQNLRSLYEQLKKLKEE